jgi:hypothetical protein
VLVDFSNVKVQLIFDLARAIFGQVLPRPTLAEFPAR